MTNPTTPKKIIAALKSAGRRTRAGMPSGDVGDSHTFPVSRAWLLSKLGLEPKDGHALARMLQRMVRKEFHRWRVHYAYYPTGWCVEDAPRSNRK